MLFSSPLIAGRLLKRYKRFLADVELPTGQAVTAHCANPGSMKSCMEEGGEIWLSRSENPKRKLAYSWELAKVGEQMVCVNTAWANRLIGHALEQKKIPELADDGAVRTEVKYGQNSRIDFLLEEGSRKTYVEVKSVTLAGAGHESAFPDSVTKRGQKHLIELTKVKEEGDRAVMLFCCLRHPTESVRPADHIDPEYGRLLRTAVSKGVEVLAYRYEVSPEGFALRGSIPVYL